MAGGRSLEQTPTWAVAVFCFVLVLISFFIEHIIHFISKWLKKKHERAFQDALEKIKSELMLLGFISLLLTVGGGPISNICVSKRLGSTWHPCNDEEDDELGIENRRGLLSLGGFGGGVRRALAVSEGDSCAAEGKVALVSSEGIHQLHRFIFVLAVFHVVYCILTMALGRVKMRRWKKWEKETRTIEYQISQDPQRFRLTRDTSFGRRHLGFWTKPPLLHFVCFFRQFVRSVPKVDYLTLRHGFIMAHLAPGSQMEFDFQNYIKRSLEEDFKVVVGISPPIWLFAIIFLLFNTHGWYSYLWLPFIPLIIILMVGTKLQVIITKMGVQIQAREGVVKGALVVQPDDHLFWFNRPCLLLYLINFVLFQNAFHLAFFVWTWYEFGIRSCFNEHTADMVIQITTGILGQILCSYVTLPLYAVVTHMGSNMKPAVFNEKVAAALRKWHQKARKNIKRRKGGGSVSSAATPLSSTPTTPSHHLISPGHLLNHLQRSTAESLQTSPTGFDCGDQESESPSPPTRRYSDASTSYLTCRDSELADCSSENSVRLEHAIDIEKEFSFGRRIEE